MIHLLKTIEVVAGNLILQRLFLQRKYSVQLYCRDYHIPVCFFCGMPVICFCLLDFFFFMDKNAYPSCLLGIVKYFCTLEALSITSTTYEKVKISRWQY